KPTQQLRRYDEVTKEDDCANEKEVKIEISTFEIERSLVPGRNVHPGIKMGTAKKNRHKKQCEDRQQCGNGCKLTAHHHRPYGIASVMNKRPAQAARTDCEHNPT